MMTSPTPQYWYDRADVARSMAEDANGIEIRENLLAIAQLYERLAMLEEESRCVATIH